MVGGAAGGAMAGVMIANNIARLNAATKKATDTWKALSSHGLALATEKGRPVLRGEIDGVALTVDVVTDLVQCAYTRVVAKPTGPSPGTVGVYPQPPGVLGKLRALIGQDIVVGDEPFDQAFLVHGKPESAAKSLLTPEIRGRLLALLGHHLSAFDYEGDRVCLQLGHVEPDPEIVRVAAEVVALAARWKP